LVNRVGVTNFTCGEVFRALRFEGLDHALYCCLKASYKVFLPDDVFAFLRH
jgi:hypothetical protein